MPEFSLQYGLFIGSLIQYGLFTAKLITFVILFIVTMGFIFSMASNRQRNKDEETLTIRNINDKLEDYKDAIEEEILTKEEYKALKKERKKEDKREDKERKQRFKKGEDEPLKPRLFVIKFEGDMHASEVENLRSSITTVLSVAKDIDEVLVLIESPGGVVHDYGLAASQLARIRDKKIKLTVAVDLIAASGGYMMACVADRIIAAPFAVLGSIGVIAELPNFNKLLGKHNVEIEHHTAGEYKSTLTMLGKNTSKGRAKFQQELEEIHTLFKGHVTKFRPQLDIDKIATGEAWYGPDALERNLVDELKTSDDFILDKSENCDIYEVSFEVAESFKEKLGNLMYKTAEKIWYNITFRRAI